MRIKRIFLVLCAAAFMMSAFCESFYDGNRPLFISVDTVEMRTETGETVGVYPAGTRFRGLSLSRGNSVCRAAAEDGRVGLVDFAYLVPCADDAGTFYPVFTASSPYGEVPVYAAADEASRVNAVCPNGAEIRILDYYCDEIYAYVAVQTGVTGFARKAWLDWPGGIWPDPMWSKPAEAYLK